VPLSRSTVANHTNTDSTAETLNRPNGLDRRYNGQGFALPLTRPMIGLAI
jgi:hypothetical protein